MEQYELNPRWQKAIRTGKLVPFSYLVRVAVGLFLLLLFFLIPELLGPDPSPRAALAGYLLCMYLIIDLNHIGNLRSYGLKRPERDNSDSPKVKLGYSYSLGLTQISYGTTSLLLLALWLIIGGYFLFGAMLAPVVIVVRLRFIRLHALRKESGLSPRSYSKIRLAILLMVIAAVLAFIHFHRTLKTAKQPVPEAQSEVSGKSR